MLGFGIFAADVQRAYEGLSLCTVLDDQRHFAEMQRFHARFPDAPIALASNERTVLAGAVRAGLGIACLPRFAPLVDGLVEMDWDDAPARPIWLGYHRDLRSSPRMRVVIDALIATVDALSS